MEILFKNKQHSNYKYKIAYLLLLTICLISSITCDNKCRIKMSNNKMSMYRTNNKLIYNEGTIDSEWSETSPVHYSVPLDHDIEYYYILESHLSGGNKKHDNIVYIHI